MDAYERIIVLDNEVEAEAARCALEDAGIGHAILSFYDSAYDGIFQAQQGWGCVMAHFADRDEVLRIVEDLRQGHALEPTEDAE